MALGEVWCREEQEEGADKREAGDTDRGLSRMWVESP